MSFPSSREAFSAGERDGLYGRPRRSTAPAYTKGYDAGFTFYLANLKETMDWFLTLPLSA